MGFPSKSFVGPLLLLVIVTGTYWKLLTKQYTWADHPDMAYQVLPWYQFEAESLQHGELPLWDPHVFGGQPLVGQMQPGAAYPLNWPLFLLPLRGGHVQLVWLNLYFILTHFFAAIFCYWLCRDLGRTVAASVFAGFTFGAGGLVGSIAWPQMLNGAIWIPLVVLFYMRSVRGRRPIANAAFAGMFLGISFLSGHHQIPVFTTLMMIGLWLVEIWRRRLAALFPTTVFFVFAALVSAVQTLPAIEYGVRSIRWVGSANPVFWGQSVPYLVHQQYSLTPLGVLGLALSGIAEYTFVGIVVLTLAITGFVTMFEDRLVRLLGGVCAGGVLLALGGASVFHGVAYLLIPLVEKARSPAFGIVIAQFGLAILAAYGIDALPVRVAGKWTVRILLAMGILPWPVLAFVMRMRPETLGEYQAIAAAAVVALALAATLYGWKAQRISQRAAIPSIFVIGLFELGTVTGQNFRHREMPDGFLQELEKHRDAVNFLRSQADLVRLEVDTNAIPYNIGDWDGVDQFRSYLGGMTANVAPFEEERLHGGRLAVMLFALNYSAGSRPFRPGQTEVFHGTSGLNIYRNPEAFPKIWTAHQAVSVGVRDLIPRLQNSDLRQQVLLTGPPPAVDRCDGADRVQMLETRADRVVIGAHMACKGMVALSQTWYPGWNVTVDGRVRKLYEAYGVLQGVVVDSGVHRIEIRYRPLSVYWGASLTIFGLALGLVLGLRRA